MEVGNPVCGDILRLSAEFREGRIAEARYKVRGCTASIATGSALTELLIGKTAAEIAGLAPDQIDEAVGGLAPESRHAALLAVDGARALAKAAGSL